jgi:signal transduction histidine kinase
LAPVSVDNLSLEQVFESLIETVNVHNQFKVKMQMKALKDIKIPHKLQINLYRILQAQLNNIVKYANATEVIISIKKTAHYFVFRIADNGVGFDPGAHTSGIGLENINRRAKVFAGEFKLNTSPGKGCEVIVEIPINVLS